MKKIFLITICIFICHFIYNCTPIRYTVITQDDIQDIINTKHGLPYIRYVIIPKENLKNSPSATNTSATILLDKTYEFISQKKYSKLEKYLNEMKNQFSEDNQDLNFCWALNYFIQEEYENTKDILSNIDDDKYMCVKLLLIADCDYEISRNTSNIDYSSMLKRYQDALNCSNEPTWAKLIQTRMKFVRYSQ